MFPILGLSDVFLQLLWNYEFLQRIPQVEGFFLLHHISGYIILMGFISADHNLDALVKVVSVRLHGYVFSVK